MRKLLVGLMFLTMAVSSFAVTKLTVLLPFDRVAYQTNEQIPVSIIRTSDADLAKETLTLTLSGEDGSQFDFEFPLREVYAIDNIAKTTEHYQINGSLLRPGNYTIIVSAYGVEADETIEVYSDKRNTSYKLMLWNTKTAPEQTWLGEKGFGFNIAFASWGGHDHIANIRSGQDYIPICVQSGGHQFDLRMECDWTDPNVLRGGTARSTRHTLALRTLPNILGTHFYDEPGLTWWIDPITGESVNTTVPAQVRSFENAFDKEVIHYREVEANPDDETFFSFWDQYTRWKATLMDSAWQYSKYGVKRIDNSKMALTQSQYGWSSFSDGYYFTITRSMDVTSGHGGYDDWGPGYWHPSFTMEIARARDFDKDTWYLPGWFGGTVPINRYRGEQYLSFQTNIQGMQTPPGMDLIENKNNNNYEGIAEANKLMGRLGTIFTTMPVTRGDVGIVFPLSYNIKKYAEDTAQNNYAWGNPMGTKIHMMYIATKLMQVNSQFVLEEDILDGTAEQYYKVLLLNYIDYLDPAVVRALEDYITNGGTVVLDSLSTIDIKGAVKIDVAVDYPEEDYIIKKELQDKLAVLRADGVTGKEIEDIQNEINQNAYGLRSSLVTSYKLVEALKPVFAKANVEFIVDTDQAGLSVTKQANGDVEYIFMVNATKDMGGHYQFDMLPVKAQITFNAKNRPIYDAIRGGQVEELKGKIIGDTVTSNFSFGVGEMRVVAITKRPIEKVFTMISDVLVETTREFNPITFNVRSTVTDNDGMPLSGSIPMRIRIIDPLGAERYNVLRATDNGVLTEVFALGTNDPVGAWTVEVTELLNNKYSLSSFENRGFKVAGATVGEVPRAVYFGNDRENMKQFFRQYNNIVLITGSSDYSMQAAVKFAHDIEPWGITATIITAEEANKSRVAYDDQYIKEAYGEDLTNRRVDGTWVDGYAPTPFDVTAPAVLFGNPDDNPLIKAMLSYSNTGVSLLPYTPSPENFPGRGRGMIAWQIDVVNYGIESVVALAYDEEGMREARGSLFQTVADQDPIMFLSQPTYAKVKPATVANVIARANISVIANVPDRGVNIIVEDNNIIIYSLDGTVTTMDVNGAVIATADSTAEHKAYGSVDTLSDAVKDQLNKLLLVKTVETSDNITAVIYWGGRVEFYNDDTLVALEQLEQDISVAAFSGDKLIAVLATGQVFSLTI